LEAYSQILGIKLQQCLVPSLILALNPLILQIRPSSHPAMNLVAEDFNILLTLQIRLEFLDVFGGLVSRGKHAERDLDVEGFGRVNHCGVAFCADFEGGVGFGGCERDDFAAPAELVFVKIQGEDREAIEKLTPTTPQVLIEE
jgi:hypothetical protein